MKWKAPPCPRKGCGSSKTQQVGYAILSDRIIDCFVCHACGRTFNQRSLAPAEDPRWREMRATGEDRLITDSFE